MKNSKRLLWLLFVLLFLTACGEVDQSPSSLFAQLTESEGEVEYREPDEDEFILAFVGYILEENGQIQTGIDGRARFDLSDQSIVRIGPSSLFTFISLEGEPDDTISRMQLLFGKMWAVLRGDSLTIDTPSGVATIRGSYIGIIIEENTLMVTVNCFEGDCSVRNNAGEVNLVAGQAVDLLNIDTPPIIRPIAGDDEEEFLDEIPESEEVIPAMTQTVEAWQALGTNNSASQTACDKPFFPVRLGATWTYALSSGGSFTWTVTSVEGNLVNATASMESVYQGPEGTIIEVINFECSQEGIYFINFFFTNLPGFMTLESTNGGYGWYPSMENLAVGSTWVNESTVTAAMGETEGIQITMNFVRNFTNLGVENVNITAGSFNGMRISSETTVTTLMTGVEGVEVPGGNSYTESVWFGEGVGILQNESAIDGVTSINMQLVSYTIPR